MRDKEISLGELKHAWGLVERKAATIKPPPPEEYETEYEADKPATTPYRPPQLSAAPQLQMRKSFGKFGMHQAMQQTMYTVQQTVQQTIVQRPTTYGVQKMAATVPFGVYGGMQMTVNTKYGMMKVVVPPGYGPGSTFYFNVPVRLMA